MQDVGMKRPVVTLVTPVFNEAGNIARYAQTVREELLDRSDIEYRVLFVDDGSQDRSWDMILELCRTDPRFQAIRLSRNFGPHVALSAGLHQAEGDAVAVLACDLQDPPEVIRGFVEKWQAGARIVWGKRQSRADSAFRVISSQFFEGLLRRYAMPARSLFATGSFLLMDRRVLDCYRQFQERNRTTFALVAWTGFEQGVVEYHRKARLAGESSWKLHKLIRAAYDTLLAFSRVPFGLVTVLGLLLFGGSLLFGLYLIGCYASGNPQPGWTSIMLTLTLCFGVHFIFSSVQGEYLSRIYCEAVQRPLYFISDSTRETRPEVRRDAA